MCLCEARSDLLHLIEQHIQFVLGYNIYTDHNIFSSMHSTFGALEGKAPRGFSSA